MQTPADRCDGRGWDGRTGWLANRPLSSRNQVAALANGGVAALEVHELAQVELPGVEKMQFVHRSPIEVEIRYAKRHFSVRVRDDGIGIDASVLSQEGRPGHFGLRGMRERSKSIGGQLEVWSEHGAGTEMELTIPATIAYGNRVARRLRLFKSKVGANS